MISIISYELNHHRIECLYDDIFGGWIIEQANRLINCCGTFEEASQRMDEAIEELRKEILR